MPELKRAELIDGIVFVPSPVSDLHSELSHMMNGWLWLYLDLTPGCKGGADGTWRMGEEDIPQPDVSLNSPWLKSHFGDRREKRSPLAALASNRSYQRDRA